MRKLITKDVFNALRLVKKANLKEEIKPVIALAAEGKLELQEIGIEGFLTVIEIFTEKKAESAIYEVLAPPFEMTAQDVENLDLIQLVDGLKFLTTEGDLKTFFIALQGLITSKH